MSFFFLETHKRIVHYYEIAQSYEQKVSNIKSTLIVNNNFVVFFVQNVFKYFGI